MKTPEESIFDLYPKLREFENEDKLPKHIAIILDGNRRWAKQNFGKNVKAVIGHKKGMETTVNILRRLRELKSIKYITLYAFSTENWKRSPEEVNDLMNLFAGLIPKLLPELQEANGRFVHLGRKDRIPEKLKIAIEKAEQETARNSGQFICVGIDYGAQDQETRVIQKAIDTLSKGTVITPEIRRKLLDTYLADGEEIPPIDLVFRTSGELRLSGLPNCEYAEFFSIKEPLPALSLDHIIDGLTSYGQRERRFGGRPNEV
jgi:undecaprenyl diphosphate synthase